MSETNGNRQKFLVLTCDSEALPGAASDQHMDRLLWGRFPEAPYEAGIGKMMEVADEFGVKMVFFHDVFEQHRYGDRTAEAARVIVDRGHDLQLHLHIEFLPPDFWNRFGYEPPTWAMNFFDPTAARHVLEHGVELFEKMAGFRPIAYRGGAFRYNGHMLQSVSDCGIPLSFQYYPATALKSAFPHGFDAGILPVFRWSNGVIEVPVGLYENPHPRKGLPRYKGFELQELIGGVQQARTMMDAFWSRGPDYRVYVMVLHSWSFLHRSENGHYVWKDDSKVRLFRDLLAHLPKDVKVVSATELLDELAKPAQLPKLQMPIEVAGTEGIPLYPLPKPKRPEGPKSRSTDAPTPTEVMAFSESDA
jgi:hypothetical protein